MRTRIQLAATSLMALVTVMSPAVSFGDGGSSGPGYLRMKKVTVIDEHGFERPMPALTMLVPSDWKFEGRLDWGKPGGCQLVGTRFKIKSYGPDGRSLESFPAYDWQWSDDGNVRNGMQANNASGMRVGKAPCDLMQPMRAADFLQRMVAPKIVPRDQWVSVEPLTRMTQAAQAAARQQQQQSGPYARQVEVDAARARLNTVLAGQPGEEWVTALVSNSATRVPTFSRGRQGQANSYQSEARMIFVQRAPQGRLDASQKLFETMIASVRLEPSWQARVAEIANKIAGIEAKGAADRAKIVADTNRQIGQIRKSSIDYRQAAQDRTFKRADQYIRDVETYRNPVTGETTELSNQYGHAWVNGNGEYLLSDSPNLDPNSVSSQTWTRLQHADP